MLGGWQRLSFKANDLFIDRARAFCEKHIAQKFDDEYNCYPMEVYCKSCQFSRGQHSFQSKGHP